MKLNFLILKIISFLSVVFIVLTLTFLLLRLLPGGPLVKDKRLPPHIKLNIEKKYKDQIEKLSKSFTTIIVPSGEDYIAIRIPQYSILLQFLDHIGKEIVSTSANLSGEPVCKTTNEVKNIFISSLII